jgi:hypothetical protein
MRLPSLTASLCLLTAALFFGPSPAQALPVSFDFSTASGSLGTVGNSLSITQSGVTVTATAWAYWNPSGSGGANDEFLSAALGRWSQGLGVCNTQEISSDGGCSTGGEHQVDNDSDDDYEFDAVLFLFSSPVDLGSIQIVTTDGDDLDARWWAGATGSSLNDLALNELTTYFGASMYHEVDNYGGSSDDRTITLDPPGAGQYVTALLLGAKGSGNDDGFKIKGLTVDQPTTVSSTPEPASLILVGTGFAGLAARLRRRRAAAKRV